MLPGLMEEKKYKCGGNNNMKLYRFSSSYGGDWSRDNVVGIATSYGLDDRGWSSSPGRVKNFLFSITSTPILGRTHSPIQWVPGALSPEVKRVGSEADHSLPSGAEVKKMWIYTSTPPYVFGLWCLID
jgi:hypothetical protein